LIEVTRRAASLPRVPSGLGQIDSLQVLRAFAVTEITWMHAGQSLVGSNYSRTPDFGAFGVDIFFAISGFIMATILLRPKQMQGSSAAWAFLRRRLIRIYPMFWIVCAFVFGRAFHRGFHSENILFTFLLFPAPHPPYTVGVIDQSWTLVFEMLFYTFLSLALLFTRRAGQAVAVVLTVFVLAGTQINIVRPYFIYFCNPIELEFIFGICVALLARKFPSRRLGPLLLVAGLVFAVYIQNSTLRMANGYQMLLVNQGAFMRVFTWGVAAALLCAGCTFWNPAVRSRVGRFALLVGNASYSIYLTSKVVEEFAYRLLFALTRGHVAHQTHFGPTLLVQLYLLSACLAVGVSCYLWIEWPVVHRLQTRFG
jgi:exopolysaccharide production protein ExoZ